MEQLEQDNKKKYVAVVVAAVIVIVVVGAWGFLNFKKKPGSGPLPKEAAVETDKKETVEDANVNREEYAKLKEAVEKSYEEAKGDLAKMSHKYFFKLLGNMSEGLEKARNADSSQDLVAAYKEYKSVDKMIEESRQFQDSYKEFSQLDIELKALEKKVTSRQGGKYAKETFREAGVAIANSDEEANAGRFIEAIESLQKAKDSFNMAMSELDKIVEENWLNGNAALKNGDNVESNASFVIVKNIDSMYPGIDDAIKRSETIHKVHPKEQKALEYEKNGLLEMAHSLYREILDIDKLSRIALDGMGRTEGVIKDKAVKITVVALDKAISINLWEKAKGLLGDLKALSPGDERIANYERMIEDEIARIRIDQLRWEGAEAEKKKDWVVAVEKYEEILISNPDLADVGKSYERAKKGRDYNNAVLDAVERARQFADNDDAASLNKAVYLLKETSGIYGLKKNLVEEINKLETEYKARLEQLEMPVSFTIISDGETSFKFWKVGQFKPFTRKNFSLKPGKYTIQGLRKGYREKYVKFEVKPIEQNQKIEIFCNEKI